MCQERFRRVLTTGLIWVVGLTTNVIAADVWSLDFETAGGYTTSIVEFTDTGTDYFLRTDGSDISANVSLSNLQGSYFFAGQDIDGEGASLPVTLTVDDVNISGFTGLTFSIYLAEDDDASNQDWDTGDYVHIQYDIDNSGTFADLILVESSADGTNFEPSIDTDFDGVGDGTALTSAFAQFSKSLAGTGSLIDIKIIFYLNSGDEDIAIDNLLITGTAAGGVADPSSFAGTPASAWKINLSWAQNGSSDDVLIAYNTSDTFGDPSGTYSVDDAISGGGTVIYNGDATSASHSSLSANTTYYYKAWSVDGSNNYSSGATTNATTAKAQPSNHVSTLTVAKDGSIGHSAIDITWSANDGSQVPDGYLIKASTADNISDPVDGTEIADNTTIGSDSGAKNITYGTTTYEWTGLSAETTYYFKVYPYTNSGELINYKTNETVPSGSATTDATPAIPELMISEVADPSDVANAKFVELYNASGSTIDFSSSTFYLSRQANGGLSWANVALTGTLAAGDIYVVAYNQTTFESTFSTTADLYDGSISGNGDDGYFIYYGGNNSTGTLVDAYGVIDEDGTGKDWEYLDGHGVRKAGVTSPNTTWTASEWTVEDATSSQCGPTDTSLPVELTAWTATSRLGEVILEWTTESEIENQGFFLSRDGQEVASFLTDDALRGQGSTNSRTTYTYLDKDVQVGKAYTYVLSDVDYQGKRTSHPEISVTVRDEGSDLKPVHVKLENAYPNPFNPEVTLSFSLNKEASNLMLDIYDIKGNHISTLTSGYYDVGSYDFNWNGRDLYGDPVSSGIYLVRLSANSIIQIQRVTLLK